MKKIFQCKCLFTLLCALLAFSLFPACSSDTSDDDEDTTNTSSQSVSTTGTISSTAVTTNSSGSKVATLTDSNGGVYTFTETASGSGTWTYQQNNVVKYSGTYTGDISAIGSTAATLRLTITKVADSSGTLVSVKEEKSFDFVLSATSFSAEIPAVESSSSSSNTTSSDKPEGFSRFEGKEIAAYFKGSGDAEGLDFADTIMREIWFFADDEKTFATAFSFYKDGVKIFSAMDLTGTYSYSGDFESGEIHYVRTHHYNDETKRWEEWTDGNADGYFQNLTSDGFTYICITMTKA